MANSGIIYKGERFTDRDLIEAILNSYFIVDYGIITKVNVNKTVSVQHATLPKLHNGQNLAPLQTDDIELLTISCGDFAIETGCKAGDQVLLLGLKNYIEKVADVKKANEMTSLAHYDRSTMKALPLCIFDDNAKCKIQAKDGTLKVDAKKIELNGNTKQLVTWSELNTALSKFLAQLTIALTTTPIIGNGSTQAEWAGLPTKIDIADAKTTSIVTGG